MKLNEHPAYCRAYKLIKTKIIRNEFNPRQRLNEVDLAEELGLSRTPVREALIMLEKDELITRYDLSRGFYIKQYSLQDINNLYEFRQIIELPLVRGIINNSSDHDIENLSGILSEVDDIIEQNQPADALVRAIDFHLCCFQVCTKNSFIIKSLRDCYEKLTIISWSCQDIGACTHSAREHKQMLDALKARDLSALMKCTQRHICGARDRMIETLKVDPDRLYYLP
jgi:DNA-binding GntR family transcriptional regulator